MEEIKKFESNGWPRSTTRQRHSTRIAATAIAWAERKKRVADCRVMKGKGELRKAASRKLSALAFVFALLGGGGAAAWRVDGDGASVSAGAAIRKKRTGWDEEDATDDGGRGGGG